MFHIVPNYQDIEIPTEWTPRQVDKQWTDPFGAAQMLGISEESVYKVLTPGNNYCEVRRQLRGSNGKKHAQGQGHLFNISDLRAIQNIMRAAGLKANTAARVFAAQRKGLI